jgi:hypothetical protein
MEVLFGVWRVRFAGDEMWFVSETCAFSRQQAATPESGSRLPQSKVLVR